MAREITFEIKEHYGTFETTESGWRKEVNLVSWNDNNPKIDIRSWNEDYTKSAKIGALSLDAAKRLGEILNKL